MLGFVMPFIATYLILGGIYMAKKLDQSDRDKHRTTYRLSFPADLDPERVTAWLRSISGTLRGGGMLQGLPTITLELWATNRGITHRLKVPWQYEPYIRPKLESLVPGVRLDKEEEHPIRQWVYAVEAGLRPRSVVSGRCGRGFWVSFRPW